MDGEVRFVSRKRRKSSSIRPWTIESVLRVPHLYELGEMIVDAQIRKEERRRKRRVRDGIATSRDGSPLSLGDESRQQTLVRLVRWAIRNLAEDGQVVHVGEGETTGYLPLPPPLLFPQLLSHLSAPVSRFTRRQDRGTKVDGFTSETILTHLKKTEYRWERLAVWIIDETLEWAETRGHIKQHQGHWTCI